MSGGNVLTRLGRGIVSAVAAGALAASPTLAQPIDPAKTDRTGGVSVRAVDDARPGLLRAAVRQAARDHSLLTQAPAARRGSCARRVGLLGLVGAGVSLAAAGVLLASTGGSDDTNGILTRWGLAGAAAGAAVGLLTCLSP